MLRSLLVFGILSAGLVAGLFSRYAALLLYLWFAMFRPVEWMWTDISYLRPSLVVGAMLVIPCFLTGIFPVLSHPLSIGSLIFLGCALLAQVGAANPGLGWEWIDYVSRLILVSLLIPRLVNTRTRLWIAVAVIGGSFLFHGAKAGLASILGGGVLYAQGLSGAFIDNNGYAVGIAMSLFLFLGIIPNVRWRVVRWGMVAAAPLGAMAIISLFSRGGLLAIAAGTLVFLGLQRRIVPMFVGIALIVVTVVYLPKPAGYEERIAPISGDAEVTSDSSAVSRMHFWRTAVVMASARPFGVGLWSYASAYDRYDTTHGLYGRRRSVHNSVLQMLAETGFGGGAAYLFLFAWSYVILLQVRRRARRTDLGEGDRRFYASITAGMMASMAAFLVGGSTISIALNDMTWFTFGCVIAIDRLSRQEAAPAAAIAQA